MGLRYWFRDQRRATGGLLLLAVIGCGPQNTGRYEVSGMVYRNGQLVAAGDLIIEPDAAKGNKGPQARAFIKQGKFATQPGQGAVAGSVVVRVLARDGVAHPEAPDGLLLGKPLELRVELPAADSEQEFHFKS